MKNFLPFYLFLFFIPVILYFCTSQNDSSNNYKIDLIKKTESINQNVLGKRLNSPIEILGDSILNKEKMVLCITVGSDCSGCREKAYQFVSRINEIYNDKIAFIIGTGLNEKFEKQYNGMIGEIYQDEKSLIKRELNLFYTPSVILLDKNGMVDRILSLFPYDTVEGYDEEKKFDEFLEAVLAL
jgi:hypothetical protein